MIMELAKTEMIAILFTWMIVKLSNIARQVESMSSRNIR